MIENYEELKTAPLIHPKEQERARRCREAYAKEQKRKEREQRLRDVLGLIELVKLGSSPAKIEEYIVALHLPRFLCKGKYVVVCLYFVYKVAIKIKFYDQRCYQYQCKTDAYPWRQLHCRL